MHQLLKKKKKTISRKRENFEFHGSNNDQKVELEQ